MKTFVCVLLLAAVVSAEPPRIRQSRFSFARQEAEEGGAKEESKSEGGDAPYAAAGFKPNKEFSLPSRQELAPPATSYGVPDNSYGAPLNTYTAPQTEYGVPKAEGRSSGEGENNKNSDSETIESSEGERGRKEGEESNKNEKSGKKEKENLEESPKNDAAVINGQGVYYVLLPGPQLQKVQFQTQNDLQNMAYTARLQYRNEDRAPIYVYTAVPQYQAPAAAYYQPSAAYYQSW